MAIRRIARQVEETVDEIEWTAEKLDIVERPSGPGAAAIIAAGFGVAVLGILTTLSEASTKFHDFLQLTDDVGPLSGKTVFAVIAYIMAWAVLAPMMWRRSFRTSTALLITAVLVLIGFVGTFPKFFELFAE